MLHSHLVDPLRVLIDPLIIRVDKELSKLISSAMTGDNPNQEITVTFCKSIANSLYTSLKIFLGEF